MLLLKKWITLIVLMFVLSTVFISDSSLVQGITTAKYFWFAASVCGASLIIPFKLSKKNEIRVTDFFFAAFAIYVFINYFCLNGNPDMRWRACSEVVRSFQLLVFGFQILFSEN